MKIVIDSNIILILTLDDDFFEILVRDKGKDERVLNWIETGRLEEVERNMSPESERGHGLFIAKTFSDKMDIRKNLYDGTDVRVVFFRKH